MFLSINISNTILFLSYLNNIKVFDLFQPTFEQLCTAHILQSACKATVIDVNLSLNAEDIEDVICIEKSFWNVSHGPRRVVKDMYS